MEPSRSKEWPGPEQVGPVSVLSGEDLGTWGIQKVRKVCGRQGSLHGDGRPVHGGRPGRQEILTTSPIHVCMNEFFPSSCCGPGTVLGIQTMSMVMFLPSQGQKINEEGNKYIYNIISPNKYYEGNYKYVKEMEACSCLSGQGGYVSLFRRPWLGGLDNGNLFSLNLRG